MSTPFTAAANADWQTLLDEITLAYSERRQALGQAAYVAVDERDVQAAAYWLALQNWLETYCTSFIDHVSGPLNPSGKDFLYFTLQTFRSAAGLNAAGFRRVPEGVEWDGITDPVWSYGKMQAGDNIAGPWIFEDLQKGFATLKWSLIKSSEVSDSVVRVGLGDSIAEDNANYGVTTDPAWITSYGSFFYRVDADVNVLTALPKRDVQLRALGKARLSAVSGFLNFLPSAKVLYGVPFNDVHEFVDIDSLGIIAGKLYLIETFPESQSNVETQTTELGSTTAPFVVLGLSEPPVPTGGRFCGFGQSGWLLKWNFTNA
jgi:hypothetical protein